MAAQVGELRKSGTVWDTQWDELIKDLPAPTSNYEGTSSTLAKTSRAWKFFDNPANIQALDAYGQAYGLTPNDIAAHLNGYGFMYL